MSKKIITFFSILISIQLFFTNSFGKEIKPTLIQKIQQIQDTISSRKLTYWPNYFTESIQNCKLLSANNDSLNSCLDKLITDSERVLTCEKNIKFWREISQSNQEDKKNKELLMPNEKVPLFIQKMFNELTQATDQMFLSDKEKNSLFPISHFDPIKWTIRGYQSDDFNASSTSVGHIDISSAFWSQKSTFQPNEIRAILAHEISHVLLNHSLKISCLAYEWQQGSGDIKEAVQYFFDPNPGPRYEALSKVSNTIEYEADAFAMTILRNANHDPKDMIRALERLEKFPLNGPTIDDHPQMSLRIERLKAL